MVAFVGLEIVQLEANELAHDGDAPCVECSGAVGGLDDRMNECKWPRVAINYAIEFTRSRRDSASAQAGKSGRASQADSGLGQWRPRSGMRVDDRGVTYLGRAIQKAVPDHAQG